MSVGASQEMQYTVLVAENVLTGTYVNRALATIRDGQPVEDSVTVQVLKPIVLGVEVEELSVNGFVQLPDTGGFNISTWLFVLTILFISTSVSSLFYVYRGSQSN